MAGGLIYIYKKRRLQETVKLCQRGNRKERRRKMSGARTSMSQFQVWLVFVGGVGGGGGGVWVGVWGGGLWSLIIGGKKKNYPFIKKG